MYHENSVGETIQEYLIKPVARYGDRLSEPSGKGELRVFLLILSGVFAGIGAADIAANIVFPALHSLDGAGATGVITTVGVAVSAKI